jgi:hypothetical protein
MMTYPATRVGCGSPEKELNIQQNKREKVPIAEPSPSALSLWRRRPELKLEQVRPPLEASSKVKRRFDFIGQKVIDFQEPERHSFSGSAGDTHLCNS